MPSGAPPVPLGRAVLSDAERQFVANLPEIRVALQRVGAPPYEVVGPNGEVSGFQAEMLAVLARTFGLRVRPVVYEDWPSVLQAVRTHEADMVLTLGISNDRLQYLAFTLGTVSVPLGVFTRQGASVPPLAEARIALEDEYWTVEIVRRQFPAAQVQLVKTTQDALQAVSEGRADAYVGSMLEAMAMLAQRPMPGLEVRQLLQTGAGFYHFGVRKDWAPLAAILNRGIAGLRVPQSQLLGAAAASLPTGTLLGDPLVLSVDESALLEQRPIWRVGAVRGLPMLNDYTESGQHSGIAAEYTEQVARRLGVGLETVPFDNVAAMLDALRAGSIDVVPFLTRTEARARDFGFSQAYFEMPYVLVGRSDGPLFWDLGSMSGRRLALAAQHPLRDLLTRQYPGIRVVDAANGNEAMELVVSGQADAAVEVKIFANLRINADTGLRLRSLGPVGGLPAQFHFATSDAARGLVPLIDRALQDIPKDERQRLLQRWVAVDLVAPFPWRRWAPTLGVAGAALLLLAGGTLWWMRRLSREVRRRRRSDEQLDDIARTVPGLVFRYVFDGEGRMVGSFFSSGTQAFLGLVPAPGQTLVEALTASRPPQEQQAALRAQAEAGRTGQPFRYTWQQPGADGSERWLRAEAVRSRTREGLLAWTGFVVDVTAEQALQRRLAGDAQERYLLLASASHELRAPTHTLSLALQSVPDDDILQASRHDIAIAREASRTLAQLLDDVLDTARASFGRLELRPQNFDLHALVAQVADAQAGAAAAKGLVLGRSIADGVPSTVHADPLRLKQVLTNLLNNAVKYTRRGEVQLSLSCDTLPDGQPALRFVVRDTGDGIAPELQHRLFEPFATGASGPDADTPSTGLGLSICQRLVALMHGQLTLNSTPGQGTEVVVQVPLLRPAGTRLPRDGVVMVCDDDPVSRLLMAQILARSGLEVITVGGGEEALARWRQGGVRLLVTDLSMPGLDGQALIDTLRAEEAAQARTERTAIVVCSGNPAPIEEGPPPYDAFISKPVDMNTLRDTLDALGIHGQRVQA